MTKKPIVLAIGGMDASAGAGILADIKAIEAAGAYGMAVMSANTFQNDSQYDGTDWVSTETIIRQIEVLQRRHEFAAVKIGLISSFQAVHTICKYFRSHIPVIWDPVLKASAGSTFHTDIDRYDFEEVWSYVNLLTPNIPECLALFGTADSAELSEIVSGTDMSILLKGGHADTHADDILISNSHTETFSGERFDAYAKHGTGCVLSSAIAARLALGDSTAQSCLWAKRYVEQIMKTNTSLLAYHIYK